MGKLAEAFREYLDNTPSEQLKKDWEELKKYNEVESVNKKEGLTLLQKFCIKANVNWLQYEVLTTVIGNIFNPFTADALRELTTIGVENKIYNGVPRIGQGNRVVDIADYIKQDLEALLEGHDETVVQIVKYSLMGDYYAAVETLNSVMF